MAIQIIQQKNIEQYSGMSLSCSLTLEGTEQIIVDTFNYEISYSYNGNHYAHSFIKKEPIKVMLTSLHYTLDSTSNTFGLNTIKVKGFRKDKKLKAREEYVARDYSPMFNDIVSQIPDSFHDRARVAFIEQTNELQNNLNEIKKNGVKTK